MIGSPFPGGPEERRLAINPTITTGNKGNKQTPSVQELKIFYKTENFPASADIRPPGPLMHVGKVRVQFVLP
jgi:hypothetical protein